MKNIKIKKSDAPGFLASFCSYFTCKDISKLEKIIAVLLVLAYVICPLDAIPDTFPVIGWIDDIGIAGIFAAYCAWRVKHAMLHPKNTDEQDNVKVLADEDVQVTDAIREEKQSDEE